MKCVGFFLSKKSPKMRMHAEHETDFSSFRFYCISIDNVEEMCIYLYSRLYDDDDIISLCRDVCILRCATNSLSGCRKVLL